MPKPAEQFVHVMLFECPDCTLAISFALTTDKRNFEDVDRDSYTLQCSCGWLGSSLGALAIIEGIWSKVGSLGPAFVRDQNRLPTKSRTIVQITFESNFFSELNDRQTDFPASKK